MTTTETATEFDALSAWRGLTPEQQESIGSVALDLVAHWLAQERASDDGDLDEESELDDAVDRLIGLLQDRAAALLPAHLIAAHNDNGDAP